MFYEVPLINVTVEEKETSLIVVPEDIKLREVEAKEEAEVDLAAKLAELQAKLEDLQKEEGNVKKNQKPVKPSPTRKYVLLSKSMKDWGKVPQQQKDLAAIMAESMEPGTEWSEEELFELVKDSAKEYSSLRNSKQDPTYLFTYYRGLKNDGKHAGFIARDFVRMIG